MTNTTNDTPLIFDRATLRLHLARASKNWSDHNFLFQEVGDRLSERIEDVSRDFTNVVELSCRGGEVSPMISARAKSKSLTRGDICQGFTNNLLPLSDTTDLSLDEEALPFHDDLFDLSISNLSLHWVNDLPGSLIQIKNSLKPDGLVLASLFGRETLRELRACLMAAEEEITGGASPRISPFVDVKDMGSLLQRAGFALPVVDAEEITVTYDNIFRLMADLRGMGEANCHIARLRHFSRRDIFTRAGEIYQSRFPAPDDPTRIAATFQIIYLHGWKPAPAQQQPQKPGSGQTNLNAFLGEGF